MSMYKINSGVVDFQILLAYMEANSKMTSMPIETFVKKILSSGIVLTINNEANEICGISCVYYNRPEKDFGFLTYIMVNSDCRGQGLAKRLLSKTIEIGKALSYVELRLQVRKENVSALNLYKSFGFYEINQDANSILLKISL